MSTTDLDERTETLYTGRELRWLADAYEQAQRIRVETGERIRAVCQGRDETWTLNTEDPLDADVVLGEIRSGTSFGPIPILGRTFYRHWTEERELYDEMHESLKMHPAWPWLNRVKGIGPTLACKILARLNIHKADTPSAFWAYCGLATVPAAEYHCEVCGLRRSWPETFTVKGEHKPLGSNKKECTGKLVPTGTNGVRCAQPKPARGQKAAYDQYAKKIMYLVGTSFLKSGGPYEEIYRTARSRLDREHPGWADGRRHLTALRKAEKLFLAHLWLVWREAEGLPTTTPYAQEHLGHSSMIEPWDMVS